MAKNKIKAGLTSHIIQMFIQDSSVTTGAGLTGLVYNSAGLVWYYMRNTDSSPTAITLATMTLGTWATGGFKEMSSSNMPGWYQLGIPNAAIATGAKSVVFMLKGATNMVQTVFEIELDLIDYQDSVRAGLTALPNAAAGANGGLPTGDASGRVAVQPGTGTGQIDLASGLVKVQQGTGAGQLDTSSGQVKVQVGTGAGQLDTVSGQVKVVNFSAGLIASSVNDAAGTTSSFIGAAGLSATDDFYKGSVLYFTSGALAGLARRITGYVGATKTISFLNPWPAAPANSSTFVILGRID